MKKICAQLIQWGLTAFRFFGIDVYKTFVRFHGKQKLRRSISKTRELCKDGVGLILDLSALTSHSQVGRDFINKISQTTIPFCVLDTHLPGTRQTRIPAEEEEKYLPFLSQSFNQSLVLNFTSTEHITNKRLTIAATPFWEFESGMTEVNPTFFKEVNRAVVFSDFCYKHFKMEAPKEFDLQFLRYPFVFKERNIARKEIRKKFSIPTEAFMVFFNFNIHSGYGRKNPKGAMESFARAFPNTLNTILVFKVSGAGSSSKEMADMQAIAETLGILNRMRFVTDCLTHDEVIALTGCSDVYLSLHRGEGLGLGMLEAMSVSVPVIATAYGGNMDFTKSDTAFLVPFKMIPAKTDFPVYRFVKEWADPNISTAANYLHEIYEYPEIGKVKAQIAKSFVEEYFSIENFEKNLLDLIHVWNVKA